jgi:hypothetical protein
VSKELLEGRIDVLDDLPQKNWGYVSSRMIWNRRATAIRVPVLHVRTTLANQHEAQRVEDAANLSRLENWRLRHD